MEIINFVIVFLLTSVPSAVFTLCIIMVYEDKRPCVQQLNKMDEQKLQSLTTKMSLAIGAIIGILAALCRHS